MNKLKLWITLILWTLWTLMWGWDLQLKWVIWFMLMDYLLWLHWAIMTGSLSKEKAWKWFWKMIWITIWIWVSYWTDIIIFHQEILLWFHNIIVTVLWWNLALDLLHKLIRLKIPIPAIIVDKLKNYIDSVECRRITDIDSPECNPKTTEDTKNNTL